MNDRKHCPECDVHYANESSHLLVHDAIVMAMRPATEPATEAAQSTLLSAAS